MEKAYLQFDCLFVATFLLAERLEVLSRDQNLSHMQLVLDAQYLHEIFLAQFHQERSVHRALGEGVDVLRQTERIQPARHV